MLCRELVEKPERNRPLGRSHRKYPEGVDWIRLGQGTYQWLAVVNTAMNLRITQNARNFLPS